MDLGGSESAAPCLERLRFGNLFWQTVYNSFILRFLCFLLWIPFSY